MYIERAVKDTDAKRWSTEVVGVLDIIRSPQQRLLDNLAKGSVTNTYRC